MRVAVLADTHIRTDGRRRLPSTAYALVEGADLVLHAGDVVDATLLEELSGFAPVHAVLGNNDHGLHLPETLEMSLAGVPVAMIHDSGPSKGRPARLRRRFPTAAVVVFGHSHIPWDTEGIAGQRLFNPGSPTDRRAQPHHTAGVLDLVDGRVAGHEIIVLD